MPQLWPSLILILCIVSMAVVESNSAAVGTKKQTDVKATETPTLNITIKTSRRATPPKMPLKKGQMPMRKKKKMMHKKTSPPPARRNVAMSRPRRFVFGSIQEIFKKLISWKHKVLQMMIPKFKKEKVDKIVHKASVKALKAKIKKVDLKAHLSRLKVELTKIKRKHRHTSCCGSQISSLNMKVKKVQYQLSKVTKTFQSSTRQQVERIQHEVSKLEEKKELLTRIREGNLALERELEKKYYRNESFSYNSEESKQLKQLKSVKDSLSKLVEKKNLTIHLTKHKFESYQHKWLSKIKEQQEKGSSYESSEELEKIKAEKSSLDVYGSSEEKEEGVEEEGEAAESEVSEAGEESEESLEKSEEESSLDVDKSVAVEEHGVVDKASGEEGMEQEKSADASGSFMSQSAYSDYSAGHQEFHNSASQQVGAGGAKVMAQSSSSVSKQAVSKCKSMMQKNYRRFFENKERGKCHRILNNAVQQGSLFDLFKPRVAGMDMK